MQNYKISKLVMVKLHDTHIPYFGYLEITGPKGGKYIVDEFCTQFVCRAATNEKSIGLHEAIIMFRACRRLGIVEYKKMESGDEALKKLAREAKATPLIRGDGMEKARVIGATLCDSVKDLIWKAAVDYRNDCLRM